MLTTIIRGMPSFKAHKTVVTKIGHQSSGLTTCCTQKGVPANGMCPHTPKNSSMGVATGEEGGMLAAIDPWEHAKLVQAS